MKKFMKKGKLFAFLMALALCFMVFAAPVTVKAADDTKSLVENAFKSDSQSNGMFNKTEDVVKGAGNSVKSLITTIAIIVLVIAVIFVGLQFTSRNSAKRQEAKSNLAAIIIGAILVFAAVAVISLSGTIAEALNSSIQTEQGSEDSDGN